jgi:hypothetical protein
MSGPLDPAATVPVLGPAVKRIKALAGQLASVMNGFVTLRLFIQPVGWVAKVHTLCDRILPLSPDANRVESFKREIYGLLTLLVFPAAPAASEITFLVLVSG